MFNDFDFDDFFERFMEWFIKIAIIGLVLFVIFLAVVVTVGMFTDIPISDFMKITHNDGNIITYYNPSDIVEADNYLKFKSEGKTYIIFYKDIKSVEQYDEDVAKGIYKY